MMALTKDFRTTVRDRVQSDPAFRMALLEEAVQMFIAGDVDVAKSILRDYINSTVGFESLGAQTKIPSKSLSRMLSASGNPQARNLFAVIKELQVQEKIVLHVQAGRITKKTGGQTRVGAA